MPKRMISTDISISAKVEQGDDFAVALFDRMIAHQDDWGRMIGNPAKVKARMRPLSRKGPAAFEKAIGLYASLGLICWYEVNGHQYIALKPESCEEYQSGIHAKAVDRSRKSQYPPPPDPAFRWPEDVNTELSGIILDGPAEHNTTQENTTQARPSCRSRSKPERKLTPEENAVKQRAIDYWRERQIKHVGIPNPRWVSKGKGDSGGVAAKFFKDQIIADDGKPENEKNAFTLDDFKGITDVFFDEWVKPESPANFDHFIRAWNGLCQKWAARQAVQKRRPR